MNIFSEPDESRYYLRDLYIFLISILVSLVISELIIITDTSSIDLLDRIFIYTYVFFPLFSIGLILSYFYRNLRIRQTGKLRSVIRYRLTVAFLFISILPSIPIVLFSSNVAGRLVESFYQIDIMEALNSAKLNIKTSEEEDRKYLNLKAKAIQRTVYRNFHQYETLINKAIEITLLQSERNYFCIVKDSKNIYETSSLYGSIVLQNFIKSKDDSFENYTLYQKDRAYHLIKINSKDVGNFVILGRRIHLGNEKNIYNIIHTENSYSSATIWKEKVPFALRLSLGIFFILIFGVSIFVSLILARQISRPIVQLANATQKVSSGDLNVRIDLDEEGEMGILIESFNQLTKDLKSKNEELIHIQRIAAWKEVAQRMAHEIKNPLTPIQLSAERIRKKLGQVDKEKYEEVVKNGTETIIGQVRVLEHLVKEFSEFARMPSPVLINQKINPIIEESVKLFEGNTNIVFDLKLSKNLPEVFLDKRLFLGVINNLIKNAVEAILLGNENNDSEEIDKSIKQGMIRITTKIEKTLLRRSVILSIEDNGPGILPEVKEKIFQPYFSTKGGHGTGIGLAIVEKTVLDHNGHLSLESTPLGGCNFKITLPIEGKK
jgi:nitrogen fixation/metabolism regulation signal transduction histidine kinase